jgi:hypothetical protein
MEEENLAPENQGNGIRHPLHPAAVCLVVAACEKAGKTPDEMGRHVLALHRRPWADQFRHWHGICVSLGLVPWRMLAWESPGEARDCGFCLHLHTVEGYFPGEKRRRVRWACKLGHLVMEYGRATERIMLAPPECSQFERHYPGPWR